MVPVRYILCLLFLLIFPGLTGCLQSGDLASSPADPPSPAQLRVGISPTGPPMIFRENGRISGLEADFARGLARRLGRTARFVELDFERQIPALLSGKIDIIMSGMTITQARSYRIAFAKPYMTTGQVSLVRLKDYNRFNDGFPPLMNPAVRVGTIRGTTGDMLVVQNKAKGEIRKFDTPDQAVRALLDNTIDAFVYDLPMNFYLGAKYADQGLKPVVIPMSREYLAWGVRKGDRQLLEQANAYLDDLKEQGRLQEMIVHWIPFYRQIYNR